ncbi:hypothetical protein ILUMI_03624 [Ignelater luminosus]|uniref:Uncharacterized protein n=1 Tax=Ignelater luminosus TaxID=2038154 RepID=A0A8K0DEA6_IGNLU|nr:hypothetical protein ILUMI_03624 [Ignelater luminosus]
MVRANRQSTIRELANELNISSGSVQSILTDNNLQMRRRCTLDPKEECGEKMFKFHPARNLSLVSTKDRFRIYGEKCPYGSLKSDSVEQLKENLTVKSVVAASFETQQERDGLKARLNTVKDKQGNVIMNKDQILERQQEFLKEPLHTPIGGGIQSEQKKRVTDDTA